MINIEVQHLWQLTQSVWINFSHFQFQSSVSWGGREMRWRGLWWCWCCCYSFSGDADTSQHTVPSLPQTTALETKHTYTATETWGLNLEQWHCAPFPIECRRHLIVYIHDTSNKQSFESNLASHLGHESALCSKAVLQIKGALVTCHTV